MDLKDLIKNTLIQIADGVSEADYYYSHECCFRNRQATRGPVRQFRQ